MKTTRLLMVGGAVILSLSFVFLAGGFRTRSGAEKDPEPKIDGRELFTREWLPGDSRSHGGDGLGPLFNARSCVACHHQGGVGGAGPRHMNVTVVSAFLEHQFSLPAFWVFSGMPKLQQLDRSKLAEIHPALPTQNSFPLHRFATEKEFAKWKRELPFDRGHLPEEPEADQLQVEEAGMSLNLNESLEPRHVGSGEIRLIASKRNTPPLFGLGLIDRVPDQVLEEAAMRQSRCADKCKCEQLHPLVPGDSCLPVSGRVARLRDGRVGRFGWKAQTASLRDFTLQACASELGLEVPGFHQAAVPWRPGYKAPGLDMTGEECAALVNFVASLPRPERRAPETEQHAAEIAFGQKLFARISCAVCHQPKLGDLEGIYSDLLLHDMGSVLADSGEYGGFSMPGNGPSDQVDPLPIIVGAETELADKKTPKFGAAPREWRTPPLWGLRDSAPYLHDGRADTISAAVAFHSGEGAEAANQFFRLSLRERQQVELFLQSLAAPPPQQ